MKGRLTPASGRPHGRADGTGSITVDAARRLVPGHLQTAPRYATRSPEWRGSGRTRNGAGNLDTDFARLVIAETEKERAAYGRAVNGTIGPAALGQWLSIGPVRSNWIQNGVRVTASDTGGLFSSTDGGRSWSDQKNDGINSYVVYAMTTTLGGLPNVS